MGWPAIQGYVNGQQIVADVLNKPLQQLAERTEYLLNMLKVYGSEKVAIDVTISDTGDGYPTVGQPVYRVADGTYAKAVGLTENDAWFYANAKAMAVGIVSEVKADSKAKVVLCGLLDLSDSGIAASDIIADATYASGRYYLSSRVGKLTASPNGPVIYVGDVHIGDDGNIESILVNPQYRDTGESHIHRSFVLSGSPMGGYAVKTDRFYAADFVLTDYTKSATSVPDGLTLQAYGSWTGTTTVTYKLSMVVKAGDTSDASSWSHYSLYWSSNGADGEGYSDIAFTGNATALIDVGTRGLKVKVVKPSSFTPSADIVSSSKYWELAMPDAARAWMNHYDGTTAVGFKLNLGMYPVLARYVPPLPENGSALTADGLEMRSAIFDDAMDWEITGPSSDGSGGPWLIWYGGDVIGDGSSTTAPFVWGKVGDTTTPNTTSRDIVLHVNRMRVGPTGFVTSLQAADGAPIKITSAQTDAEANQGALQISLDVDFSTTDSDVAGSNVVKRINGSKFETGPVVEKVIAGAGISVDRSQGTVTISAADAVYAGDFETIALRNAKQDLAGGVFPYTKLLGWTSGSSSNVATGFTAKFRVPDYIPYKKYNVVVSASVFGESSPSYESVAAFKLTGYSLKDYTLNASIPGVDAEGYDMASFAGSVASPSEGSTVVIPVTFAGGYSAFDPIVIHGFSTLPTLSQRQKVDGMLLKEKTSPYNPIAVYPGYFVGINIARCDVESGTEYTDKIGFLSLRWNLVEA